MATIQKSDFPKFVDGDVLIVITTTQYYKLHSQTLSTQSPFFAEQLAAKPAARLTAQARRENAAAYRFEFQPPAGENSLGHFLRLDVSESGRSRNSMPLMPDFDNGKPSDDDGRFWDWIFGAFYGREPAFNESDFATLVCDCMNMVERADSIGSSDKVCRAVDHALLRQTAALWRSIAGNPRVWIEFGRRVRSESIFKEAAVHLIGQWGALSDEYKAEVPADIREIVQRKAYELDLSKEAVEMRILGHYPQFMMRSATEKPGRPSYSSDIYGWMAVGYFRHWVAQSISDDRSRRAPDGGLNFYSAICEGGQAYLTHTDFQEFHRYFPMSIKACHVFEANMGVLKEDVKKFVDPLLREQTHVKRADYEITWLTCAVIGSSDYPWDTATALSKSTKDDALLELYDTLAAENARRETTQSGKKKHKARSPAAAGTSSRVAKRPRKEERPANKEMDEDDFLFCPEEVIDAIRDDEDHDDSE